MTHQDSAVRGERGMVTVELAVAILAALLFMIMLCWGIYLVVVQVRLVDVAGEVARQAARGDQTAVVRAESVAPAGSTITVRVGQVTQVEIRLEAAPMSQGLPKVPLSARAEVVTEPGQAQSSGSAPLLVREIR
jgi:hypothetical protein